MGAKTIGFPKPTKTIKKRKPIKKQSSIGKLKKMYEDIMKTKAKERDGYTCQRCHKKVEGSNAHGSHVIPVSASDYLRFDLINIKCLCHHCHINWWHKNPIEAGKWFEDTFPDRYTYLQAHKYDIKKWNRQELLDIIERKGR